MRLGRLLRGFSFRKYPTSAAALLLAGGVLMCLASDIRARDAKGYSQLSGQQRRAIELRVSGPKRNRHNPYSTPMYYLMYRGRHVGPKEDGYTLEKNRPDWQEAILRDYSDLGMTSTLALAELGEWSNTDYVEAFRQYLSQSKRLGLGVGIRLDMDEGDAWKLNPRNAENRIKDYLAWVEDVARLARGQASYYIVGDELNHRGREREIAGGKTKMEFHAQDKRWTADDYLNFFKQVKQVIRKWDNSARVSMYGLSGLKWADLSPLLQAGYLTVGDAIAANASEPTAAQLQEFTSKVRALNPKLLLVSNGVGYVGASNCAKFPKNTGNYPLYSDHEQAERIAKIMLTYFDAGWDSAPYYLMLRQWVLPGRVVPYWYGFFGISDYVVNQAGTLSVRRYPGWHAYQTVAQIFNHRPKFKTPHNVDVRFSDVATGSDVFHRAYVVDDYQLILLFWAEKGSPKETSIQLGSNQFTYPVQIDLFDHTKTTDVAYEVNKEGLRLFNIQLSSRPTILRLVAEKQDLRN